MLPRQPATFGRTVSACSSRSALPPDQGGTMMFTHRLVPSRKPPNSSETQPCVELYHARPPGSGEPPEIRGRNRGGDTREVGVVERVKHVSADLQPNPLGQLQLLGQRQLDVPQARPAK